MMYFWYNVTHRLSYHVVVVAPIRFVTRSPLISPPSPCPQQMVFPTLLARLRKGAFLPTSSTSYPCLLPLMASFSVQTLLSPTSDSPSSAVPFCVAVLETLWASVATPPKGHSVVSGGRYVSGWLPDVACAHVECLTFLLLKLPPSGGGVKAKTSEQDDGAASAGGSSSANKMIDATVETPGGTLTIVENLARAVRHFAVDGAEDEGEGGVGGGLRQRIRSTRRSSAVIEAFGRALGQLHTGGVRGAGVMGSADGWSTVWAAVLKEFKRALDKR